MAIINKLEAVGDAIRAKTGKTDLLTLDDMVVEIAGIETGGQELPEEAFNITGDCSKKFADNSWSWFVDMYGNKVITADISNCDSAFIRSSKLEYIPFDFNTTNKCLNYGDMFNTARNLKNIPLIIPQEVIPPPTSKTSGMIDISAIFTSAESIREIDYDFFNNFITQEHYEEAMKYAGGYRSNLFQNCYSLRKHPDLSRVATGQTSTYSVLYYCLFKNCYCLDEVIDLPVVNVAYTTSAFSSTFSDCYRLKRMTFKMNEDKTPIVVNWSKQTIDLSQTTTNNANNGIGYTNMPSRITAYNSGITEDKCVNDDATYQALKNTEDWYSTNSNYSRYNHDSAVETINSLPDVSAGSGNTIKFRGFAGTLTDGGAINTLTEAEIAVAAAKGWTVSLV